VNKLSFALMVFALICFGREAFDDIKSRQGAYQAYKDQTTELARSNQDDYSYADVEGYIVDIMYELESLTRLSTNKVEIVAVQALHFQKGLPVGNWGSRQVLKIRQRVLMISADGHWLISEIDETSSEPTYLGESVDTK
jgi:hypothetical protein